MVLAMVIVLVTFVALSIHGMHFFSYFFPDGAPKLLAPMLFEASVLSLHVISVQQPLHVISESRAGSGRAGPPGPPVRGRSPARAEPARRRRVV